jgi:hypothetical protein
LNPIIQSVILLVIARLDWAIQEPPPDFSLRGSWFTGCLLARA